ncbi:MAG: DUF4145 domain-containing protein [Dehalococcoidia bacterium]|nr:DUF4145 domain-containing protein [Dehalococcoidia bacterium]
MEVEPVECPHCGVEVNESLVMLHPDPVQEDSSNPIFSHMPTEQFRHGYPVELDEHSRGDVFFSGVVTVSLMYCPRDACRRAIVALEQTERDFSNGLPAFRTERWFALPKLSGSRRADALVPDPYKHDFEEAAALLSVSPRMSAVLSRRVLADLLEEFAGQDNYRLSNRVENFIKDSAHPRRVRENVNILRSIADFGAHTKRDKDDQAVILDVTAEEAEWTLGVVERLFDHFIVEPAKDAAMRASFNEKRIAANGRPLPELPPDGDSR